MYIDAFNPLTCCAEIISSNAANYSKSNRNAICQTKKIVHDLHKAAKKQLENCGSFFGKIDFGKDPSIPLKITKKIVRISIDTIDGIDQAVRTLVKIADAVKNFLSDLRFVAESIEFLVPIFEVAKTLGFALAPLYAFQFGNGIYEFVTNQIDLGEFLVNSFKTASQLGKTVIQFIMDLAYLGKVPLEVLTYLWPFDLLSMIISASAAISHARGWYQTAHFVKSLEQLPIYQKRAEVYTDVEMDALIELIRGKNRNDITHARLIQRIYNTSHDTIVKKVEDVVSRLKSLKNSDERIDENAQKDVRNTIESLRGRAKSQLVSHQVGTIAESVNFLANSILFISTLIVPVCPVLAAAIPVAGALKGISGTALFGEFLYSAINNYIFNNSDLMREKACRV